MQMATVDYENIIPPKIFRPLEILCRTALSYGANHPAVRQSIQEVMNAIRGVSTERYHHQSPAEVMRLQQILQIAADTRSENPPRTQPVQKDPIEELRLKPYRLPPEQIAAAQYIREVRHAFGRFLTVNSRSLEKVGGSRRAMNPVMVMKPAFVDKYQKVYVPWYEKLSTKKLPREKIGVVPAISVVFQVILEGSMPNKDLDKSFGLGRGSCLSIVVEQLAELANALERYVTNGGG